MTSPTPSRVAERIRIAFVGKGGAGKSSIAGTLARLLARRGEPVLALDSDPLPGMPYALGIEVDDAPLPDDVVVQGPNGGQRWVLRPGLDARSLVEEYSARGPDDVRYLQFGNTWGHISTLQRAQFAWSQVVRELDPAVYHIVGDLPGGTRQAMFGWGKYADSVLIVVEPTTKSLHAAARLSNLSKADWAPRNVLVVANKVRDDGDVQRIRDRLGREVFASVPADPGVYGNDRRGLAPLDGDDAGLFVAAVDQLLDAVIELHSAQYSERADFSAHESEGGLMKIAVVGKGGSGKTTTSAILARTLGRTGAAVVALDCDTNPNLGLSLGVGDTETERLVTLRDQVDDGDAEHTVTWHQILDRYGSDAPDGVRLSVITRIENPEPG